MRCEFLFVMKVRVLKVCDERGEGREVHGNTTNGRKDSGVFVSSLQIRHRIKKSPIPAPKKPKPDGDT